MNIVNVIIVKKCRKFDFLLGERLQMLKLSLLEVFFRAIPECSLMVFSTYTFSKVAINKWRYSLSSILLVIIIYIIRCLPINFGMHTVLAFITSIVLSVSISRIDFFQSIKAVAFTVILEFICEGINIFIILYVFGLKMNDDFSNNVTKLVYRNSRSVFICFISIYLF